MISGKPAFLPRADLQLHIALQELDQTITDRQIVQNRIDESWKKLNYRLKALDRRWDCADYTKFQKLYVKHSAIQHRFDTADRACKTARKVFQDSLNRYNVAHSDQSELDLAKQIELKQFYQRHGAMSRSLNAIFKTLMPDVGAEDRYQVTDGAYDYIPLDISAFLSLLIDVDSLLSNDVDYADNTNRYRPVSFLEVGAGTGRNLVLAKTSQLVLLRDLQGFDINPDLIKSGLKTLGPEVKLHVDDALTFDYGSYDVIYSYRPMQDNKMQAVLETHMARSMRMTAYLLAPTAHDLYLCPELTPMLVSPHIWKKTRLSEE